MYFFIKKTKRYSQCRLYRIPIQSPQPNRSNTYQFSLRLLYHFKVLRTKCMIKLNGFKLLNWEDNFKKKEDKFPY